MRVLGALCLFTVLLLHTASAAPAEPCSFLQAGYQSLDDPALWLSSNDDGLVVIEQNDIPSYGFEFVGSGKILQPTYDAPYGEPVEFSFFDENLIAFKNPSSSSPAPAYLYLSAFPDIEGKMFELRYCKHGSSMTLRFVHSNRPAISVSTCPFYRAVYTNVEDDSLTLRSEKDQDFFASLKIIIKGDRTPERPYTFGFTNGSGRTFIQTNDEGNVESSGYMFFDESLQFAGIDWAEDPAPAYFLMTNMKNVPASTFRLQDCRPAP